MGTSQMRSAWSRSAAPFRTSIVPSLRARGRQVLDLPLLYKVLLANSVVILIGATLGTYLATTLRGRGGLMVLIGFVITGLLVSVGINFLLLKLALTPITRLRETMGRVQAGDLRQKAAITGHDRDADQLAQAFNTMLDAIDDLSRTRATHILSAQEQERKRIARELHDETSQILTSLLISLAMVEQVTTSEEARARIADTRSLAHQTLRAVRNLSMDLRPSALDDLGLLPALRWYLKEYQQKCKIEVEFCAQGLRGRLAPETETALYRIVQESLTNTAKHAAATKVWVTLEEAAQSAVARIRDNGQGFDAEALFRRPWQDRGLGLAGMMERATLLNGTLEIVSHPGEGTTITARVPLIWQHLEEPALPARREVGS